MSALFFLVLAAAIVYGLHRLTTPKLIPARIKRDENPSPRNNAPGNDWDCSGR
jgi:hypothetical protein